MHTSSKSASITPSVAVQSNALRPSRILMVLLHLPQVFCKSTAFEWDFSLILVTALLIFVLINNCIEIYQRISKVYASRTNAVTAPIQGQVAQ
jgi:diacylglycerol kinase